MGTPANASGFFSNLFGRSAQTQEQPQAPQQQQQFQGQQQMQQQQPSATSLGLPSGATVPNPQGNNPNGLQGDQQQQQQQGQQTGLDQNQLQQPQGQQQQQQSPVDALSSLLNNKPTQQQNVQDFFAISPDQISGISQRAAYGNSIPAPIMQEFQQDPVATLPKILDHVTQSMMRDMVPMIAKMTQAGTAHISNQLRTELPQSIGRQQAVDSLVQQNPMMKPFADLLVSNMQQKNPTMSANEIQTQAGKLLNDFMDYATSTRAQQTQQQQTQQQQNPNSGAETINWETLLD